MEYYDRWGMLQQQDLTDFVARIFQHELDHLNGLLFLDRLENTTDLYSQEAYEEMAANGLSTIGY